MNTAVSFLLFLQTNFKGLSMFLLHSTTVPCFSTFQIFDCFTLLFFLSVHSNNQKLL